MKLSMKFFLTLTCLNVLDPDNYHDLNLKLYFNLDLEHYHDLDLNLDFDLHRDLDRDHLPNLDHKQLGVKVWRRKDCSD